MGSGGGNVEKSDKDNVEEIDLKNDYEEVYSSSGGIIVRSETSSKRKSKRQPSLRKERNKASRLSTKL